MACVKLVAEEPALIECDDLQDIFVSGLARVEPLGVNTRFVFHVQRIGPVGKLERNVNVSLIMPTDQVARSIEKTILALGSRMFGGVNAPFLVH